MKTAALLEKILKRIIETFFQFQFFLFQQKSYSNVPRNFGSPMIPNSLGLVKSLKCYNS